MAITYENVANYQQSGASPQTISGFNAGTNAGRVVLLFITGGSSDNAITGITYGGASMTKVQELSTGVGLKDFLFVIDSAASGSNNFVVSASGNINFNCYAASYSGAVYENSSSHYSPPNVTSDSLALTLSANAWMVAYARAGGAITAGGVLTIRGNGLGTNIVHLDSNGALSAGSQTGSISFSSSWNDFIVAGIKPPAASGPANSNFFQMFGGVQPQQ
jgi:hypothetical protein